VSVVKEAPLFRRESYTTEGGGAGCNPRKRPLLGYMRCEVQDAVVKLEHSALRNNTDQLAARCVLYLTDDSLSC